MTIDILSDLHLDFYFYSESIPNESELKAVFDPIFHANNKNKLGDILVIAGDIGHFNHQNIEILKILQSIYYKHIICVLGNHDYYLIDDNSIDRYSNNSFRRVQEMRELINAQTNMHCLNGDVIEIEGIKFGGCDSSYDNSYIKQYFPAFDDDSLINTMWKNDLNDYRMMGNIKSYMEIYHLEIEKLKKVYNKCDVMITHVNPSHLDEHIPPEYFNDRINTFFTFDGHKYMKDGSMKYWIFGHTHNRLEYSLHGVQCICNPFGYPREFKNSIYQIVINK